jgi:hypothetical protein
MFLGLVLRILSQEKRYRSAKLTHHEFGDGGKQLGVLSSFFLRCFSLVNTVLRWLVGIQSCSEMGRLATRGKNI